jgi:hypothetical protein
VCSVLTFDTDANCENISVRFASGINQFTFVDQRCVKGALMSPSIPPSSRRSVFSPSSKFSSPL